MAEMLYPVKGSCKTNFYLFEPEKGLDSYLIRA